MASACIIFLPYYRLALLRVLSPSPRRLVSPQLFLLPHEVSPVGCRQKMPTAKSLIPAVTESLNHPLDCRATNKKIGKIYGKWISLRTGFVDKNNPTCRFNLEFWYISPTLIVHDFKCIPFKTFMPFSLRSTLLCILASIYGYAIHERFSRMYLQVHFAVILGQSNSPH